MQRHRGRTAGVVAQNAGVKAQRQNEGGKARRRRHQQGQHECPADGRRGPRRPDRDPPGPHPVPSGIQAQGPAAQADSDQIRRMPGVNRGPRRDPPGSAVGTTGQEHAIPARLRLDDRHPGRAAKLGVWQHGHRSPARRSVDDRRPARMEHEPAGHRGRPRIGRCAGHRGERRGARQPGQGRRGAGRRGAGGADRRFPVADRGGPRLRSARPPAHEGGDRRACHGDGTRGGPALTRVQRVIP